MNLLIGLLMFAAFWGVLGALHWFFGDRQGDIHQHHLPPYRNDPRD